MKQEFKVRLVEGSVEWCSNPPAYTRYQALTRDYYERRGQPGYQCRKFGKEQQHRDITLPTARLQIFCLYHDMDFEEHDGAVVEGYRVVIMS